MGLAFGIWHHIIGTIHTNTLTVRTAIATATLQWHPGQKMLARVWYFALLLTVAASVCALTLIVVIVTVIFPVFSILSAETENETIDDLVYLVLFIVIVSVNYLSLPFLLPKFLLLILLRWLTLRRYYSYPRNCDVPISALDQSSSHVLKDHCLACSKRHRSIVSNTNDAKLVSWFQGLRKNNIDEYKKVMRDHASTIPSTGRGVRAKFDLLEYFNLSESVHCECEWSNFGFMFSMGGLSLPYVMFVNCSRNPRYAEVKDAAKGQKTGSGWEAMDWNRYNSYFQQLAYNRFDC